MRSEVKKEGNSAKKRSRPSATFEWIIVTKVPHALKFFSVWHFSDWPAKGPWDGPPTESEGGYFMKSLGMIDKEQRAGSMAVSFGQSFNLCPVPAW